MKRTELKRKTPLKAKTPIKRGDSQLKRTQIKPKPAAKAVRKGSKKSSPNAGLEALNRQARLRDGDTCVMCGLVVIDRLSNVHHRRNRGAGGSRAANVISNLLTLCGTPVSGCHGDVTLRPAEIHAERYGWKLPTNGKKDPATVPVLVAWLGWALPTADGEWLPVEVAP